MGETTKIQWTDHTFNAWIGWYADAPEIDGDIAGSLHELFFTEGWR